MKKLIRIEVMLSGTDADIRTVLKEFCELSRREEVVSLNTRTLDTFQGHWTGENIIKSAGKIIGLPLGFRKGSAQRE